MRKLMKNNKITPIIYKEFGTMFDNSDIKNAQKISCDVFSHFNLSDEDKGFLSNFIFKTEGSSVSNGVLNIASRKKISLICGDFVRLNIIQNENHHLLLGKNKGIKMIVVATSPRSSQKFELNFHSNINLVELYKSLTFFNNLYKAEIGGKFKTNKQFANVYDIYLNFVDALNQGNCNDIIEMQNYLQMWVENVNKKDMESWNKIYIHNANWAILFGLFSKEIINVSLFNKYSKLVPKLAVENLRSRLVEEIKLRKD